MSKFNLFLEKNNKKIVILFLFLCPIIDILTSFFINILDVNLTIGIVLKTLFGFYMIYYLLFIFKSDKKRYLYLYALVLLIYFLIYFFMAGGFYFSEVQFIFKVFYFPLSLIFLYVTKKDYHFDYKFLSLLFIVYLLLVFIPLIFNIGFESYDVAKKGSAGLFNSANEIGGVLSILFPFFLYYSLINIKNYKSTILNILMMFIYLFTIFGIGTKAPVIGFVLTVVVFVIYYFISFIKRKKYKEVSFLSLGVIAIFILALLIIPNTTFYKNIKIHVNHFNINSYVEIFTDFENLDNIVFSERLTLLKNNFSSFKGDFIIGSSFSENDKIVKTVEIDFVDILFTFGVLGFLLFFTPLIYIIYLLKKEKNKINLIIGLSLLIAFLLALFTGHILIVPTISFLVALLISLIKGGVYEKSNNLIS